MKVLRRCVLLCTISMTLLCGCDEDVVPNQHPSVPEITGFQHDLTTQVVIIFVKSVDPQNDPLRYDFYLNNQLVGSTVDPEDDFWVFSNLTHSTDYAGSIIVTDEEGNVSSVDFQFTTTTPGPVFMGNLTVTTQAAIDIFLYTDIKGTLTLRGKDIRDLSALSILVNVRDKLIIDNTSVRTLHALENVYINEHDKVEPEGRIGKEIEITNNANLQTIPIFKNVERLERLVIGNNDSLTNLDNFTNLKEFYGVQPPVNTYGSSLVINGNARLENLDGFSNVSSFWNTLITIKDNASLTSLDGFRNATFKALSSNVHHDSQNYFNVLNNTLLEKFCIIRDLIQGANDQYGGHRFHFQSEGNLYNPTELDIIHGFCEE